MKGMRADILKRADFSNGGVSSRADEVTIVATIRRVLGGETKIEPIRYDVAHFEADVERAPAVALLFRSGGMMGDLPVCAVPVDIADDGTITETREGAGPMMGGAVIRSSDSRFAELAGAYGAVDLHDRFETTAQYATYD